MKIATIFFLFATVSPLAFSASFNCTKGTTSVEQKICSDPELSDLDSTLAQYYRQLLADLKSDPHDKGSQLISSYQRKWLYYRNLCETDSCLYDMYSTQLVDIYINHVDVSGEYKFFTQDNTGKWFHYVLTSYGIKQGQKFEKTVQLLRQHGWTLAYTEDDKEAKDGVFCGSGLQAACHATFKNAHHQEFAMDVFMPIDQWLIIDNEGGPFTEEE